MRQLGRAVAACVAVLVAAAATAADHVGRVMVGPVPVPGATVTATHDDQRRVVVTDLQGVYRFTGLAEGVWTLRVEMIGFAAAARDLTIADGGEPASWELTLLSFDDIVRTSAPVMAATEPASPSRPEIASRQATAPPGAPTGFQRAQVNRSAGAPAIVADAAGDSERSQAAADGFLVNGSVNNGAASPFAQLAAFGNNRRGARSLYNGGFGVLLGNSAWDTRPFSFTSETTPKPSYSDAQILASFAGPLRIPGVMRNGPTMFLGFQRTVDHNASTATALVPTALERAGDFSRTLDRGGRPLSIVDPATGLPFAGNAIPSGRLSPQAASLLRLYPLPNVDAGGRYNYETTTLLTTHQDAFQSRFTKVTGGGRNQWFGNLAFQQTTTDAANVFSFVDSTHAAGVDTTINWAHRFSQRQSMRLRYQFTHLSNDVAPYFSGRTDVSGDAGIGGSNQEPANWGPPRLIFSTGIAGLSTAQSLSKRSETHAGGAEGIWFRGRHTITAGGDLRMQRWSVVSQQDARGTFTFSGGATGSDLADFLLGLPHASSIAFGNPDKYLRAPAYDAYLTDDWRISPVLTVNAGVRWEYEAPLHELRDRLANLDIAPDFSAATPVLPSSGVGALTGRQYGEALMRGDWRGVQPRAGLAWRPIAGSSLVVRAGYGIYRNTSVYEPIALLLAQQPPLSNASSVETTAGHPLTLASGFAAAGLGTATFAVDPDLRIGFAHNWQVLVQRDLPASLTMTASYLGTKGSHLLQESLPNTDPLGAAASCASCPRGFVYLTSNGRSRKDVGQIQLRRRLHNGLTATVQYTLSKASDDAGAFTGVRIDGAAIAQDWQHLDAEHGPSNFDQRHLLTAQIQYTTGMGATAGAFEGIRGRLLNGWTVTSQLTAGSGLPFTPVYLTSVPGTGVTGTIRPNVTGALVNDAPDGVFVNPAAFTAPTPGQWGTAGRNSATGPKQFALDASLGRSFQWGERLTLDWRINATNVLNRVTYSSVNAIVGSPQFGLPTVANPMRKVQSSLRVRF